MAQDCWGPDYEQLDRERLIRDEAMKDVADGFAELPRDVINTLGVEVPYDTMTAYLTSSFHRRLNLSIIDASELTGRVLHGSMSQGLIEYESGTLRAIQQPET